MAIGISEPIAEIVSTSNVATYAFGSFTPATSGLLVAIAFVRATVAAGSMVNTSGTSLTWTQAVSTTWNSGADSMYLYWARTPGATAASVYTIDVTGDNGTACLAYMFAFTGHNLTLANPLHQVATAQNAASANPAATFSQVLNTNNGYVAAWAGGLSSSNPANVSAAPASWTETGDNGIGTPTTNASGAFRAGGETTATLTFTAASTAWGMIAAEIYEASQGPSPPIWQRQWRRTPQQRIY